MKQSRDSTAIQNDCNVGLIIQVKISLGDSEYPCSRDARKRKRRPQSAS
jgi:hypothetical protein